MLKGLVLWDFDGTLGYREGAWSGTLLELLQEAGLGEGLSREEIRPSLHKGFRWNEPEKSHRRIRSNLEWWEELYPELERAAMQFGADEGTAQQIAEHFRLRYLTPRAWQLFPDTLNCLKRLKELGWSQEVASNHVPELEDILSFLGIRHFFHAVHSSAWIGFEKPHPRFFDSILLRHEGTQRKVMVGDNVDADYWGAKKSGLAAILVRKAAPEIHPFAESLYALPECLEALK